MQVPIKLLVSFDALVDAIAVLGHDDQVRLRHILDQHINNSGQNTDQNTDQNMEAFWAERGCHLPLKEGLPLTLKPSRSGQTNISIDHDQVIVQEFEADRCSLAIGKCYSP
jgi:hypothetical protein